MPGAVELEGTQDAGEPSLLCSAPSLIAKRGQPRFAMGQNQSSNSMLPLTLTEMVLSPPSSGAGAASAIIGAARILA